MPPRTIWKGAISFGLVSIPVKTYGAISEHKTGMRMLCPKCKSPLQFKRMCPKHMEEVPWNDIVKGFEVQKGKYVTITPKELEKLELESGRLVEVFQFVDADKVQGHQDKELEAEGAVRLRRRGQAVYADWLRYDKPENEVNAQGNVRLEQRGDVLEGASLRLNLETERGAMPHGVTSHRSAISPPGTPSRSRWRSAARHQAEAPAGSRAPTTRP